jgi:heme-binding protein
MAMSGVHQKSRRGLGAVFAATAVGGVATVLLVAPGVPSADAAADPCLASEIAKTVGNVAINTGMYLDSHPQTNQVLTTAAGQPVGPQSLGSLKAYFDANPQAATDLQVIQRPLTALTTKCNLPISLPQVLGLMQSVQGGLPVGLPAAVSPAQALSGATGPGSGAASAVVPAMGAVAGPVPVPAVPPSR